MKKYWIFILFIVIILLSGCGGTKVNANYGSIVFEFPEEYLKYLPYDEVPSFTFEFEGTIYTNSGASRSNHKYFSRNDDFIFSEILADFFKKYEADNRLTVRLFSQDEQYETKMNRLVEDKNGMLVQKSEIMKVKNGEIFNEIAYINLENGLSLTVDYRRFISDHEGEEKTYYSWRYVAPISMVLHYPVMLHTNAVGEKIILIVPLPPKVVYHLGVSRQLPLENLFKKDDYFEENFRRFYYPEFSNDPRENEDFDRDQNIRTVKDFYIRDLEGREEEGKLYFTYLGYNFEVIFEEETFLINIL